MRPQGHQGPLLISGASMRAMLLFLAPTSLLILAAEGTLLAQPHHPIRQLQIEAMTLEVRLHELPPRKTLYPWDKRFVTELALAEMQARLALAEGKPRAEALLP